MKNNVIRGITTLFTIILTASLGTGIVLDRHTCPATELYDIATDWKE